MKSSEARTPSRSAIAIVAVVGVLAAVAGCWLLRVERTTPDTDSTTLTVSVEQVHLDHASSPASHTPFKSAGLHRDRPPTPLRVIPVSQAFPSPISLPCISWRPDGTQARAPATAHSGRDLLTHFCIARR
ncbi:hypothetical protein [Mycobacterium sp. MFM001]|uniref:hypothetical protein n=1 Tax=Mycobacterium sp. MFM001 TaxID=2049453 RepID=UPI000E2EEBB3|nr:hypothetical protein [Mycobacterium sp. MFM001]